MVAKAERNGGSDDVGASTQQSRRRRSFSKPSWLLCNIADLDERIKMLTRNKTLREKSPDSFSARANSYYHERPQLLELLNDLYNNYLSLADRYCHSLAKNQHQHHINRCSSPVPIFKYDENIHPDEGDTGVVVDSSDAQSSLCFQPPLTLRKIREIDADMVIVDLVMKTVEYDIIMNELNAVEKKCGESSRKMELQKNLLDVLESERLILLNDNATLGYRLSALVEENKGLASESSFLKRKAAAELARYVLKTREDHRVCVLSRKIEDLQGQIYGLDKRNKEYYEQLVKQEEMKKNVILKGRKDGERVDLEGCFRVNVGFGKFFSFKVKKIGDGNANNGVDDMRVTKLWDKVKKFDLLLCGPHVNSATS